MPQSSHPNLILVVLFQYYKGYLFVNIIGARIALGYNLDMYLSCQSTQSYQSITATVVNANNYLLRLFPPKDHSQNFYHLDYHRGFSSGPARLKA